MHGLEKYLNQTMPQCVRPLHKHEKQQLNLDEEKATLILQALKSDYSL